MKKRSLRFVLCIASLCMAFGLGSKAEAQQEPIAGGYGETSVSDREVVAAARFAVSAQRRKQRAPLRLVSIRSAEVQVVAGLNYRLTLGVEVNGKPQDVRAVVYKDLKQRLSLSSWEALGEQGGGGTASTIEQRVKDLAEAYESKNLGRMDAESAVFGRVKIVIEHSLADDNAKDRFVVRQFKNFEQAERWLRSREREELPARVTKPFRQCSRGLCTYDFDGGILHNQLYLQKVGYGYRKGKPYIKTIFLLDGD